MSLLWPLAFLFIQILSPHRTSADEAPPSSRHKSVTISLYSNWRQTPLHLETCEFLAGEEPEWMWNFIDVLYDRLGPDAIHKLTPRDQYDVTSEFAKQILQSDNKLALLKFSLSLRVHSPAVAMFNQMANDLISQQDSLSNCDAFVELSVPISSAATGDDQQSQVRFTCDSSTLKLVFETQQSAKKNGASFSHPPIYKVDHEYPSVHSQESLPIAVLYGEVGTKSFLDLHLILSQAAETGMIKYFLRHFIRREIDSKVSLSGYGVELAIKSTEYKAQDDTRVKGEATKTAEALKNEPEKPDEIEGFIFSKLTQKFPDQKQHIDEYQNHLLDSDKEIAMLKVWELQELSLQASKKILSSPKKDVLRVLTHISQNFPTEARYLTRISVDQELRREIDKNQQVILQNLNLAPTDTALFVNGLYFDAETIDVFSLLNTVKQEFKLIQGIHQFVGGDSKRINKLIGLDINNEKQEYQIDIRDGSIIYINDIENDNIYKNWPSSLQDMLRAMYPGMLRNVRRNIFHLVIILDPSKKEAHDILKLAESFYIHKAPVRIGFIFAVSANMSITGSQDAGVACLESFNFISQDKTPYDGLSFLTDVIASVSSDSGEQRDLLPEDVINLFKAKYKNEDIELIFGTDSDYDTGRKLARDFIKKTGIGDPIKVLLNGVILKDTYLNADLFEEAVLTEIMRQTNTIQKAIYKGELTDDSDVLDWLMTQKSVMPRLNKLILNQDPSISFKYLDLKDEADIPSDKSNDYKNMKLNELKQVTASTLKYISTNENKCKPVTLWLAVNCDVKSGRRLLLDALSHLQSNSISMRLGIIHNSFSQVAQVVEAASLAITKSNNLISFLIKFINHFDKAGNQGNLLDVATNLLQQNYLDKFKKYYNELNSKSDIFNLHSEFCKKIVNIDDKESAAILGGRIIKVPLNEPFVEDDFVLMEKYAMTTFAEKILSQLTPEELDNPLKCSDMVLKLSTVLLTYPQSKTRHEIKYVSDKHSSVVIEPKNPQEPAVNMIVILDPLTRGAQKLAPILTTFHQVFNSEIKILFNCVDKHSEMPLKNFFRFVIEAEPNFGNAGMNDLPTSKAFFASVPTTPLFTLGMATPENWMVQSVKSPFDLDNIHLEEVGSVWANFELEYLLLEGHCFELSSGNPPRGLQFTLGTNSTPVMVDTIVMANLGYFQLKANPGSWILKLRSGRSADIYNIISHEGTDSPSNLPDVVTLISSFRSHVIKIRVNKKTGKQHEELLYSDDDDEDSNSLWNNFWSPSPPEGKKKEEKSIEESEDSKRINIFSLASGHLYERLLRIMMLSVLKHTNTPVKFWFLKNYLSPTFKESLPYLAQKYHFEYELVQYKWPRWLHQQTEKQRIIWGYKILFLDVLFPLDVKKIIFVDADQVVRTDLKELRDLDLEGAPYGYTPFCDSRKDMEGFRFWKTGYWNVHLHGRKYHISALYVVDLQKFRRIAAGDRLRGQYQGLSQDPNSLSNLDQDLPNNMIHQVSIKSLPQDWLWCETWCDDESKKTAKTIDLCNNPKTKEPKLTGARRIVPEWEGYDNEIKDALREFEALKTNKIEPPKFSSENSGHQHIEL